MSMEARAILFVAIMLLAIVKPKLVAQLSIRFGTVALIIMVAIWVLGTIMGIEGGR